MPRRKTAQKWIRTKADKKAIRDGCYVDLDRANHVCDFFETFLKHSKGRWAGEPFTLQKWQRERFLMPLFGWVDTEGRRRFRIAYIEVPKKNGKSTLASGISLYLLCGDGEAGAEVYNAATDRDQAAIVYKESANMVDASPSLNSRLIVTRSAKHIGYPETKSTLKAISSDAYTNEGLNISGLTFDEMHALKDPEFWDALRYGGASREEPLFVIITTAGHDKTSLCYTFHTKAKSLLEGRSLDTSFFPLLYGADAKDDWTDPRIWKKANPSYGVTMDERQFKEDCEDAKESPRKENTFKRYRLNMWTQQDVRWIQIPKWEKCKQAYDFNWFVGKECFAAIDLSSTSDITCFMLMHRRKKDLQNVYRFWPFFYLPEDVVRKNPLYQDWAGYGYIQTTPGDMIDYSYIRRDINEIAEKVPIQEIAVDRLFQGAQLSMELAEDGFEVISFGQGFLSMAAPSLEWETAILSQRLEQPGNPVLDWMVGNVAVETDSAENMKPSKKKSGEKIDGVVTSIMALGRAIAKEVEEESMYETEDITVIR